MDPRFDTSRDPRFKRVPKNVRKVEVDERFSRMFRDKNFTESSKVDARGNRLRKNNGRLKLEEFYELAVEPGSAEAAAAARKTEAEAEGEEAGGEESSTDEEEESESSEEEEANVDTTVWDHLEPNVLKGDATRRLAIMGCDWDHVTASDVLVLLRTYLNNKDPQTGGSLRSGSVDRVVVYPSDFGLQRMEEEAKRGPAVVEVKHGDEEEDERAGNEALRKYQIERTKFHYAMAQCDSAATASFLYDQLDGLEVLGMCPLALDIRFVPDDLEFPHKPTSESSEMPKRYEGPIADGPSLTQSKIKCSWDEAPVKRKRDLMKKTFSSKELADMDLQAYLASSSGEEDGSGAEALRQLVGREGSGDDDGMEGSGKDDLDSSESDAGAGRKEEEMGDMEATFSLKAEKIQSEVTVKAKQIGGKAHTIDASKSTWDQYLEKRKEKRKERKAKFKADQLARREGGAKPDGDAAGEGDEAEGQPEASQGDLELLAKDGDEGRNFNLRGTQRGANRGSKQQAKVDAEKDFKLDVDDPRIAKVFSSADFQIDPTNPQFRRSEGMKELLQKKRQKKTRPARPKAEAAEETGVSVASAAGAVSAEAQHARSGGAEAGPQAAGGLQLFARKAAGAAAAGAGTVEPGAAAPDAAAQPQRKKRKVKRNG